MEQNVNNLFDDAALDPADPRPQVTHAVTRGAVRLVRDLGFAPLLEFKLKSGRRVDVAGLDAKGRFLFIEVKSSLSDYRTDAKWSEYLDYCDWFYFAVAPGFPTDALPSGQGLVLSDGFETVIKSAAPEVPMNAARRRAQMVAFGRQSALRLSWVTT